MGSVAERRPRGAASERKPGEAGLLARARLLGEYLEARGRSGLPIRPTEALDLADCLLLGRSCVPTSARAEQVGVGWAAAARPRQGYGEPSLLGERAGQAPYLHVQPGTARRPSVVRLVRPGREGASSGNVSSAEDTFRAGPDGYRPRPDDPAPALRSWVPEPGEALAEMESRFRSLLRITTVEVALAAIDRFCRDGSFGPEYLGGPPAGFGLGPDAPTGSDGPFRLGVEVPGDLCGEPPGDLRSEGSSSDHPSRAGHSAPSGPRSIDQDQGAVGVGIPGCGSLGNVSAPDAPLPSTSPAPPETTDAPEGSWASAPSEPGSPRPQTRVATSQQAWSSRVGQPEDRSAHAACRPSDPPAASGEDGGETPGLYPARPAAAGSADRAEDEAQAALLRVRLGRLKLLRYRAVAPLWELADALGTLRQLYGSRSTAARVIASALSSSAWASRLDQDPAGGRRWPGYAFWLAWKPRLAVRSPWWLRGIESGWNGAPALSDLRPWVPAREPVEGLTLYPADGLDLDGALTAWADAAHERQDQEEQAAMAELWRDRDEVPGARVRFHSRTDSLPWQARDVLAEHGADFDKTLRRWQRAARGGSEQAAAELDRLDRICAAMAAKVRRAFAPTRGRGRPDYSAGLPEAEA